MSSLVIYDVANELLQYVNGQLECTLAGRPCRSFVAVCEPVLPCCDYLSVYVDRLPGGAYVEDCSTYDDEVDVVFTIKLVRPCKEQDLCESTLLNDDMVKSRFVDAMVIRSAMRRFVIDSKPDSLGDCFTSYSIGDVVSVCDELEYCSVWSANLTLSMSLCDDGECTVPFSGLPERCECEAPVVVGNVPCADEDLLRFD